MKITELSKFEQYLLDIIMHDCNGYCVHCANYSPETLCREAEEYGSILRVPKEICRESLRRKFEERRIGVCN